MSEVVHPFRRYQLWQLSNSALQATAESVTYRNSTSLPKWDPRNFLQKVKECELLMNDEPLASSFSFHKHIHCKTSWFLKDRNSYHWAHSDSPNPGPNEKKNPVKWEDKEKYKFTVVSIFSHNHRDCLNVLILKGSKQSLLSQFQCIKENLSNKKRKKYKYPDLVDECENRRSNNNHCFPTIIRNSGIYNTSLTNCTTALRIQSEKRLNFMDTDFKTALGIRNVMYLCRRKKASQQIDLNQLQSWELSPLENKGDVPAQSSKDTHSYNMLKDSLTDSRLGPCDKSVSMSYYMHGIAHPGSSSARPAAASWLQLNGLLDYRAVNLYHAVHATHVHAIAVPRLKADQCTQS